MGQLCTINIHQFAYDGNITSLKTALLKNKKRVNEKNRAQVNNYLSGDAFAIFELIDWYLLIEKQQYCSTYRMWKRP